MSQLILVDGAAGFLGGHVTRALLQAGFRVRATDRAGLSLADLQAAGAEIAAADLLDPKGLDVVVAGVDQIVHAAALFDLSASKDLLQRVNVTGTDNLCQAAEKHGVRRFIHVSSGDVYGPLSVVPATEDHPFHPINDYALSKAEAEQVVTRRARQGAFRATIVRPSVIYGPKSRYIACILLAVPAILIGHGVRRVPFFSGGARLTPVHVEDVARAVAFLAGRDDLSGQAFNVAQPEMSTVGAFFQEIFRDMGLRLGPTVPMPETLVELVGRIGLRLPEWLISGVLNSYVARKWRDIQRQYGLDPDFVMRLNRELFSYFIGERAFSTDRLLAAGFTYKYPSEAAGMPPTIRWYVENRWLPPPPAA